MKAHFGLKDTSLELKHVLTTRDLLHRSSFLPLLSKTESETSQRLCVRIMDENMEPGKMLRDMKEFSFLGSVIRQCVMEDGIIEFHSTA